MITGIGLNYKMRAFRIALGLTQEEVADMVGTSNVTVSLYERGLIDSGWAQKISDALYAVKEKQANKYGYWYDAFIELQTALNEITVWTDLNGRVPVEVIKRAKELSAAFTNI